jgi:hypothetical protein
MEAAGEGLLDKLRLKSFVVVSRFYEFHAKLFLPLDRLIVAWLNTRENKKAQVDLTALWEVGFVFIPLDFVSPFRTQLPIDSFLFFIHVCGKLARASVPINSSTQSILIETHSLFFSFSFLFNCLFMRRDANFDRNPGNWVIGTICGKRIM